LEAGHITESGQYHQTQTDIDITESGQYHQTQTDIDITSFVIYCNICDKPLSDIQTTRY